MPFTDSNTFNKTPASPVAEPPILKAPTRAPKDFAEPPAMSDDERVSVASTLLYSKTSVSKYISTPQSVIFVTAVSIEILSVTVSPGAPVIFEGFTLTA